MGYKLSFVQFRPEWAGGTASVVAEPGNTVQGVVYSLDPDDLKSLDLCKSTQDDSYWRVQVAVELPSYDLLNVWTYVGAVAPGAPFHPSEDYLNMILTGAAEHGLCPIYIDKIKCWSQM